MKSISKSVPTCSDSFDLNCRKRPEALYDCHYHPGLRYTSLGSEFQELWVRVQAHNPGFRFLRQSIPLSVAVYDTPTPGFHTPLLWSEWFQAHRLVDCEDDQRGKHSATSRSQVSKYCAPSFSSE